MVIELQLVWGDLVLAALDKQVDGMKNEAFSCPTLMMKLLASNCLLHCIASGRNMLAETIPNVCPQGVVGSGRKDIIGWKNHLHSFCTK